MLTAKNFNIALREGYYCESVLLYLASIELYLQNLIFYHLHSRYLFRFTTIMDNPSSTDTPFVLNFKYLLAYCARYDLYTLTHANFFS